MEKIIISVELVTIFLIGFYIFQTFKEIRTLKAEENKIKNHSVNLFW